MDRQEFSLGMLDIDKQQPRRMSMNAAYQQVGSTALIDTTCGLYGNLRIQVLSPNIDQTAGLSLDTFHPDHLIERLRSQLATFAELRDPGLDLEQQDSCLSAIQALHANVPSDLARRINSLAQGLVTGECQQLRAALLPQYASAPHAIGEIVAGIKSAIDCARVPDPNQKPLLRWVAAKKAIDKVRQRRTTIPPSSAKTILDTVAGDIRNLHPQCLQALAAERIAAVWPTEKAAAITMLNDYSKRGVEVAASLAAVQKSLEETRAAIAAEQHVSRASVVRVLPGHSAQQVLAGILAQLQTTDMTEAIRILRTSWESRLREACPEACPWIDRTAPLADLVRGMPPPVLASAWRAVVEQSQGPGQSLYEIIKREGIEECARFLYQRSEPTVHLSGRDMSQLGLSCKRSCIVTLPAPIGPHDSEIRGELIDAFEDLDRNCTFAEAPPTDRTVTATRIIDGFVIGIEGQCPMLLNYYQEAADQGHRMHLFGLLPDSTDGQAIPAYRALKSLSPSIHQEKRNVYDAE